LSLLIKPFRLSADMPQYYLLGITGGYGIMGSDSKVVVLEPP
jgi:hypothetical protein